MIGAWLPAGHGDGSVLPAAQACPAGQRVHSNAEVRFVASEYLPAGHGSVAEAPSGQKLPEMHGLQLMAPPTSWNVPPGHSAHDAASG